MHAGGCNVYKEFPEIVLIFSPEMSFSKGMRKMINAISATTIFLAKFEEQWVEFL